MKYYKLLYMFFLLLPPLYAIESINVKQIKQQMIQSSIQSYPGNCPCPYNRASNGYRCGKRSAWSRAGGYSPLCYENDITTKMIEQYTKNRN